MVVHYVYQYLRENNTPYYIGKGKGRRAWNHRQGEVRPPKDKTRITIVAHNLYEYESYILEIKLISLYGRIDLGTGILHNKTDGGGIPSNYSTETRKKLSDANKGKITSEDIKQKIRESKTGIKRQPFSEEWKKNMSLGKTGKKRGPLSEEAKKNISDGRRRGIASKFRGIPNSDRGN